MEDINPNAFGGPSDEAVVEGLARSVDRWRINPTTARLQHVYDAADHPAVIDPRLAACVGRQERLAAERTDPW